MSERETQQPPTFEMTNDLGQPYANLKPQLSGKKKKKKKNGGKAKKAGHDYEEEAENVRFTHGADEVTVGSQAANQLSSQQRDANSHIRQESLGYSNVNGQEGPSASIKQPVSISAKQQSSNEETKEEQAKQQQQYYAQLELGLTKTAQPTGSNALIEGLKNLSQNPEAFIGQNDDQDNMVLIMSKADYDQVQGEYEVIKIQQRQWKYKVRKYLSLNIFFKWMCCCLKVKDQLDLTWDEMSPMQKKHRIKTLWKKAKRVFLFQRLKLDGQNPKKGSTFNHDEEGDDILENINSSSEHEWKWWIIRQQNPLPQLWSIITNSLTIYALFVTPAVIVFPDAADVLGNFELFVDACFSIDIVFEFIRLNQYQKESEFTQIRLEYLKSYFIFDCVAALPGLITLEKSQSTFNKICRFIHYDRVFLQLNYFTENILMGWLGYTRQKVNEYVDFIKLEITIILMTHLMACMWIIIGGQEGGWVLSFVEQQKLATGDPTLTTYDFKIEIYVNAFYFILTTITTVGYGDINGTTTYELLFSMCVEFVGLTFFSFLTGTISVMFSGDQSFESLINAHMEQLDLWLLRLQNCNRDENIPNQLYHSIKEFIQDAFVYDYNLIIEEFNFYKELPAQIQNQISESLFKTFKTQFSNFFLNLDVGFQHQLIVNMYCRIYEPGRTIISYGQKLNEMYFITKGNAIFYDQKGVTPFISLPQYSFFGEYQLMFDLRANFVVKVGGKEDFTQSIAKQDRTCFLCVSQDVFQKLFDQFPKSKFVAQKRALERRKVFIAHLEKLEAFLQEKDRKQKKLTKQRLKNETMVRVLKVAMTGERTPISKKPDTEENDTTSSRSGSGSSSSGEGGDASELSDDNQSNENEADGHTPTKDDFDMKSQASENYQISVKSKNPEQEARDDYLKDLMNFRKDEIIHQDESDESDHDTISNEETPEPKKEKQSHGVEDAYELVDRVENKMNQIANVLRGVDKRMSYNLRLMGSVTIQKDNTQNLKDHESEELMHLVMQKSIIEKKIKILPRIKEIQQWTKKRLDMNNAEGQQLIDNYKKKIRQIKDN